MNRFIPGQSPGHFERKNLRRETTFWQSRNPWKWKFILFDNLLPFDIITFSLKSLFTKFKLRENFWQFLTTQWQEFGKGYFLIYIFAREKRGLKRFKKVQMNSWYEFTVTIWARTMRANCKNIICNFSHFGRKMPFKIVSS